MSHIDFRIDTSGARRRMDRLGDGPDIEMLMDLESVIVEQFAATQLAVHKQTLSLQRSGKVDTDTHAHGWRGTISYGGSAPGAVHPDVQYAQVEQARATRPFPLNGRGRQSRFEQDESVPHQYSHNFMEPVHLPVFHRRYVDAFGDFYRRTS